ncbi:MAG: ABC transporter permease, partial [Oscillospiraceae bacterium]
MAKYTIKRLLMALVTLFIVACLTFVLMNSVPGSPWSADKQPSAAVVQALNEKYGLDKPKIVQLGMYFKNLAHGDMGVSLRMQKNRPVVDIIVEMFPVSAKIGFFALLWAIIVGIPLGCLAAYNRGKWIDSILRVICTVGISMPSFVVASLLLYTFAGSNETLRIFPTIFDAALGVKSYILPCFALGVYPMCYTARQTRSAMLDSINQDYVKTARAKGLKNKAVIFKHALRNALIPVITYLGPQVAFTFCGGF